MVFKEDDGYAIFKTFTSRIATKDKVSIKNWQYIKTLDRFNLINVIFVIIQLFLLDDFNLFVL